MKEREGEMDVIKKKKAINERFIANVHGVKEFNAVSRVKEVMG